MPSSTEYVLSRGAACLSCRRKKQRCDAEKPTCRPCIKSGKECVYKAPPKSKNQELIDKIRRLEEQIEKLDPTRPPSPSSPCETFAERDTPSPPSPISLHPCRTSPCKEPIPGTTMFWNYDPIASVNLHDQMLPSDLTPRLREDLIGIFMQNREMCYFDLHVGRFIASLSLPPTDPQAPHPTLVDAILLVGCYFSRAPSLAGYESSLLAAANNNLAISFQHTYTDRLHDFIRASNLIAFYYFCKGMYQEAYQQITMSCHMAVTCGLHQITSSTWSHVSAGEGKDKLLPYPADAVEQGERIHTFWQAFCLDKMISMVACRQAHLLGETDPLLQILTPWPRPLSDYETGMVSDIDKKSFTNRDMNQMSTFGGGLETLASLRSQGYALVYKSVHLLSGHPTPQEILITDSAIQTFTSRLPHLMNSGDCGEIPATPGLSSINYKIVTIHTLAHVASLVLHQHGADVSARRRRSTAAQGIAAVIRQLSDADYPGLFVGLGHLWYTAGRILLTIAANASGSVAEENRKCALFVISALKRISMVYLPLTFRLRELQEML